MSQLGTADCGPSVAEDLEVGAQAFGGLGVDHLCLPRTARNLSRYLCLGSSALSPPDTRTVSRIIPGLSGISSTSAPPRAGGRWHLPLGNAIGDESMQLS